MAFTRIAAVAAFAVSTFQIGGAAPASGFLGAQVQSELRESLHALLEAAHAGSTSPVALRIAKIEAAIAKTFQSLPKNDIGRLAPTPVRYLVHNYFAKEHAWQIQGLEPQGMRANVSQVHGASVLQDKSPAMVEALVEAYQSHRGLGMADVAAMIAMLERLILDESTSLLYASYFLNGMSSSDNVEHDKLHSVLQSYLLLFEMGQRADLENVTLHQMIVERVAAMGRGWPTLVEFESDIVMNYDYEMRNVANPFVVQSFPFEVAAHMVDELAQKYGKWQHAECSRMKAELMSMDSDGTGLIPLSTFYMPSKKHQLHFTESADYLREVSALDESWKREPRVRIANYVNGPSNCIASSKYYSVCCLNECDELLNELEGSIRAPSAPPARILELVGKLASSSMASPKPVRADLAAALRDIAERNEGEVPLHGRLFAQWLHRAFPYECSFPHVAEDTELDARRWLGGKAIATVEERASHVEAVEVLKSNETESEVPEVALPVLKWTEEEVLPLQEGARPGASLFGLPVRVAVQGAMCLLVLRFVLSGVSAAAGMGSSGGEKKKAVSALPASDLFV